MSAIHEIISEEERAFRLLVRHSFATWFQGCAEIPFKDEIYRTPVMNTLQQRIDEGLEWQAAAGVPQRSIVGKYRQGGSSRYHMNRAYWMGRNWPLQVGVIADDKNTTPRLLAMWEAAYKHDFFGDKRWGNEPASVGFPRKFTHGTQLWEETANDPRAGQGATLQVLVSSETAHYRSTGHSTGEAVFQSIANTVPDLPGTWIALESTANGKQGVYYFTYRGSATLAELRNGIKRNGYFRAFAAWFESDDYVDVITPDEGKDILQTLTESEIRLIERFGPDKITPARLAWRRRMLASPKISGDEQKLEQEYPSDEDSMFISSGTQVFDDDGLNALEQLVNVSRPKWGKIENEVWIETGMGEGWLRMWEDRKPGCAYLISADFMEGEEADGTRDPDCHAVSVWRAAYVDEGRQLQLPKKVAAIKPECRVNLDIVLDWIAAMYRYWGQCLVVPEVNSAFGLVDGLALRGVTNVWMRTEPTENRRVGEGKKNRKRGWKTTEQTREQIVANMQRLVREQGIDVRCPRWLEEMRNFITKSNGRKEAAAGHHDDWVMCDAIGLFCLNSASRYLPRMTVVGRTPGDHTDSPEAEYAKTQALLHQGVGNFRVDDQSDGGMTWG